MTFFSFESRSERILDQKVREDDIPEHGVCLSALQGMILCCHMLSHQKRAERLLRRAVTGLSVSAASGIDKSNRRAFIVMSSKILSSWSLSKNDTRETRKGSVSAAVTRSQCSASGGWHPFVYTRPRKIGRVEKFNSEAKLKLPCKYPPLCMFHEIVLTEKLFLNWLIPLPFILKKTFGWNIKTSRWNVCFNHLVSWSHGPRNDAGGRRWRNRSKEKLISLDGCSVWC